MKFPLIINVLFPLLRFGHFIFALYSRNYIKSVSHSHSHTHSNMFVGGSNITINCTTEFLSPSSWCFSQPHSSSPVSSFSVCRALPMSHPFDSCVCVCVCEPLLAKKKCPRKKNAKFIARKRRASSSSQQWRKNYIHKKLRSSAAEAFAKNGK